MATTPSSEHTEINVGQTFQYTLMGGKWPGAMPVITWSFAESPATDQNLGLSYSDYPTFEVAFDATQAQLIRAAFQTWEDAGNIDFVENVDYAAAQVRIGWDSIDGRSLNGGTLGQATAWSTNSTLTKVAIQLDLADRPEAYFGSSSPPAHQWSFYATAAHEIGHALGLDHSASPSALMYPQASSVTSLSADDLAALIALYGAPQRSPQTPSTLISLAQGIDPVLYLAANQDVALAGIDPAVHFNSFGWHEGRNPNAYFDINFYLTANPDIKAAGVNPLQHYLQYGWRESRDPSSIFGTNNYLEANSDVKLAGINPLLHYLSFGIGEGRSLV